MECLRLRVKDIDFELNQLIVRDGKGKKDRLTMLPEQLKPLLRGHLDKVKITHQQDLKMALGKSICLMLWPGNIRMQGRTGYGNMVFFQSGYLWTLEAVKYECIISEQPIATLSSQNSS